MRGHRVPNDNGNALVVAEAIQIEPIYIAPFIAIFLTLILLLIFLEVTRRARQRKKILKQAMRKEENNDL